MNIFDLSPVRITKILAARRKRYPNGFLQKVGEYREYCEKNVCRFYTFFYCISGNVEYIFEDKVLTVCPGQFIFLDKYHPFTFGSVDADSDGYIINFLAESGFIDEPVLFSRINTDIYLPIFVEAASAFKSNKPGFEFMTISIIMKLISIIKNDLDTLSKSSSKTDKIKFAVDYMKMNIGNESFSIEQLAAEMNVSTTYLRSIFLDVYSMPPIKYFKKIKMKLATDMLSAGNHSVSEVSKYCGYSDISYFCHDFKKFLQTTPKQFKTGKY